MFPEPAASNGPLLLSLWQYTGMPGVHLSFRVETLGDVVGDQKGGTLQLIAKAGMAPELIEGGKFEHQAR